jgi:hypothetical protein
MLTGADVAYPEGWKRVPSQVKLNQPVDLAVVSSNGHEHHVQIG